MLFEEEIEESISVIIFFYILIALEELFKYKIFNRLIFLLERFCFSQLIYGKFYVIFIALFDFFNVLQINITISL